MHELLPPDLYRAYNKRGIFFFDINALVTLDALRDRYGYCTVNNWFWGGDFKWSGFRPWDCPEGARLSQHKFGRAFDCKFRNVTADEVREDMRKADCFNPDSKRPFPYEFQLIRRVENYENMNWFHFDLAPQIATRGMGVIGDSLTTH